MGCACVRVVLAPLSDVFQKTSSSLMKKQVSQLAKSAASNIFLYLVSFGYMGERMNPGLRLKDWILRALLLAVKSPWPQKVGSRGQIYLEGRGSMSLLFKTANLHLGS